MGAYLLKDKLLTRIEINLHAIINITKEKITVESGVKYYFIKSAQLDLYFDQEIPTDCQKMFNNMSKEHYNVIIEYDYDTDIIYTVQRSDESLCHNSPKTMPTSYGSTIPWR